MAMVVYFEIPTDDIRRANNSYPNLFAWGIEEIKVLDYFMITTSGKCHVSSRTMKMGSPQHVETKYMDVAFFADHAVQFEKLGGYIIVSKAGSVASDDFVICLNTEIYPFGLWEKNIDSK